MKLTFAQVAYFTTLRLQGKVLIDNLHNAQFMNYFSLKFIYISSSNKD